LDDQRQPDAERRHAQLALSLRGRRSSVGGNKPRLGDRAFPNVGSHTAANDHTRANMKAGGSSQGTGDVLL